MTASHPLAGLNIVVTRPREQAAGLVRRIDELGGKPFLFPLLEIEAVRDDSALREQISRLNQTDLVIFISPNAVRYGLASIGCLPPNVRVATIGQGSAKALHEAGIAQVIAPAERFDSEGLLALPAMQDVDGKRVMIFRGDGGRELLGDTLRARGAKLEYATCYRRSKPELDAGSLLAARPDAVTVTSSEALGHLMEMLDAVQRQNVFAIPLFVPHARIADAAKQQGWHHVIVTESGDDGMMSGLIAWANTKRK